MNYYLIKEYLKTFLTDESALFHLKVMFWVLFSMVCCVIAIGSVALIVNLLNYLPWVVIPLKEDSLYFFKALTMGLASLSILIVEMDVMYKVAGIINKRFEKNHAGGRYEK
jgi:hypothetical protein